jgi:hypothetical protein
MCRTRQITILREQVSHLPPPHENVICLRCRADEHEAKANKSRKKKSPKFKGQHNVNCPKYPFSVHQTYEEPPKLSDYLKSKFWEALEDKPKKDE